MSVDEYIHKMKKIQESFLNLIDEENNDENKYSTFMEILIQSQIRENHNELKSFLRFLSKITQNHFYNSECIDIFEKVLLSLEKEIRKYYYNSEIFITFRGNKRILLFLIKSKILSIDKYVLNQLKKDEYSLYFFPEIKDFLDSEKVSELSGKLTENFEEKRRKGVNDSYICELIRNDSIEEFIKYANSYLTSFSKAVVNLSIFETNSFLIDKMPTLIEYAAFYGSMKIIQYLNYSMVNLTPSMWIYAIHSKSSKLVHYLEDNKIVPNDQTYKECYIESIKCHHNSIAKYIQNNYLLNEQIDSDSILNVSLESYNFEFIQSELINQNSFYNLCVYDYCFIVEYLLKNRDINEKNITVFQFIFLNIIQKFDFLMEFTFIKFQ